jgi:disulfide bond formation protein DsbB
MSDGFLLAGGGLGLVGAVIHGWLSWRKGDKPNLVDAIALILTGVGALTGLKVCYYAYHYSDVPPIKDISIQTFIGGFALSWVAAESAIKKFHDLIK